MDIMLFVYVRECLRLVYYCQFGGNHTSNSEVNLQVIVQPDSMKTNIPIELGDFSVIDREFGNIRENFDAEMKRMEDEINKFRSAFMNKEFNNFLNSTSTPQINTWSDFGTWHSLNMNTLFDNLKSPLIQEDGNNKCLKLRFDVSQYSPDEVVVKIMDNKLLVQAKHEEKTDNKSVYREYKREFFLPRGTNLETIKSSLSQDGILSVEAPLPVPGGGAGERIIPIAHE